MKLKSMLWSLLAVLAFSVVGCSDDDDVVAPDPQPEGDAPVLTVNATSVEVAAEGGEQSFTFKVDHATDASVVAACAADWVEVSVKESRTSFDGTVSLVVKANETTKARETSVKLSYKGAKDATVAIKQAGKAEEKPQPEDPDQQNNNGEVVELTAETFAQWIYDYKTDTKKENFLSDIPAVIDFYGPGCGEHLVPIFDELAKEYNGKINFFRFNFTKPEHKVVKDYMGVTLCPTLGFMQKGAAPVMLGDEASNAITTNELMRAEIEKQLGIKSEGGDQPQVTAPKVFAEGEYDKASNKLKFSAACTTKDAAEGFIIVYATAEFENQFLLADADINKFFKKHEQDFQVMNANELKAFNSNGVSMAMPYDGAGLTVVVAARNAAGENAAYAQADKVEDPVDPDQPVETPGVEELKGETYGDAPQAKITIGLGKGDGTQKDNQFYFVIDCPSKDATYASCSVWPYAEVEPELNAGKTLADLMNGEVSYVCDANDLKTVNIGGLALTENQLKRNTSYSLICDLRNAKGGRALTHHKVTTAATSDGQGGDNTPGGDPYVGTMNQDMFKAMIWDYTQSADFQYKGSNNVFIEFGAAWCGNCTAMEPIVYNLSGVFANSVSFFSIDKEANKELFDAICPLTDPKGGIPLFVMITADGKMTWTQGKMSESKLRKFIEDAIGGGNQGGGDQPEANGPAFTMNGSYNPTSSTAIISMQCSSKDAASATYVFVSTMMVENLLKAGSTLPDIVASFSSHVDFDANALADFNGDGYVMELPMDAGSAKSFVLVAKNAKGGKTAQRVDIK